MIELWLALLPIAFLLVLMVLFRFPAIKAMPLAYVLTALIAYFSWRMHFSAMTAATLKGAAIAFEILLIVSGAIFLLEILKGTGFIKTIDNLLKKISKDKRVQVIIIAWSFSALIEGAAGFGTPAALAAPLLVGLGVAAFPAVVVSLIANVTAVSFGAIGTPVLIGLGNSLQDSSAAALHTVSIYTALVHGIIGIIMPLFVVCMLTKLGREKSFRKGLEVWPFAIYSGLCFVIPFFLVTYFLGPEFPSLLGGLIGFFLTLFGARIFIPKKLQAKEHKGDILKLLKGLSPYFLAVILLVCTRFGPLRTYLEPLAIGSQDIFGSGISYSFAPLLSPGIILFITAFITLLLMKKKPDLKAALEKTGSKAAYTFGALLFAVGLVQLFLLSGNNSSGLASMPVVIAEALVAATGSSFVFFSPFIGALGSFISGSNTVSNLLMGPSQEAAALSLALPTAIIIALQNIGGGIGNMISTHNIIAASATVGIRGQEGKIIRKTIIPAIAYAVLAGIIGFCLIKLLF